MLPGIPKPIVLSGVIPRFILCQRRILFIR
jgi:hypothetical protein